MHANDMHNKMGYVIATVCPLLIAPIISFIVIRQSEKLRKALETLKLVKDELEATNAKLFEKSSHDSMTGLLNREAFFNRLESVRTLQPCSLLIIDVDHFKKINDIHGHFVGDGALMAIAHCITECVGKDDSIGRIGGEEFGIYLATKDDTQVTAIAEIIRAEVNRMDYRTPHGECVRLSVSIGGVVDISTGAVVDHFQTADRKLYEAKRNGRNCVFIQSSLRKAA
ncbi:GGDEF domain-containing protein [Phyllobacterium sp. YR531]|uniref:GGDEF domain-containing protein n=1 Tax=Phyllobacterium sp. YR531 TaxID=1144343 RepID=UPI00026F7E08|nr:GGDEF domain-containing protein [Phyllobacterium sp. YR531]EJN05213.1 diguanylate cyclase (GGDEF) domain-containing protein [Phyllobacterium sp. YR531]